MAAPIIKIKRSSVPGKIPTTISLPLGELALNTNDGKVYIQQDSVGIGSTVIVVNPWSVGLGSNTYNTFFTAGSVGIGTTIPTSSLHVVGNTLVTGIVTASSFVGNVSIAISTSQPSSPSAGTLWYNSNLGRIFIYYNDGDSSQWVDAAPFNVGIIDTLSISGNGYVLGNLGIGTTNPTSKLHVVGNTLVTGIVTATTFVGALTGTATSTTNIPNLTGDITSVNSVTSIAAGVIVNADINASAGIVDTKLATISTALKVSNSATTATNANTVSTIVARDASGNFSAGTITASLTGTATSTTNIPNLTGAITSVNTTTSLGSFTSLQLLTALTDETGTGANVFATSPTLVTPVLGAATATSIVVSSGSTFTNGPILVGAATSTGTASQRLQVTGGAYVSGNLGIGTINPTVALQLSPNASISNLNGNTNFGTTAGAAATVAQFYHLNGNSSYLRIKATRNTAGADWTTASTKLVQVIDVTEMGYIEYNPNGANYGMAFGQGGSEWARFLSGGNLGIGTTTPTSKLHVVGDVRVSGVVTATDFNSTSDISLKDNIQTIINPLDKIIKLNGVTFNWKENQKPSIGVIAQELEKVLPELVTQGDIKSVNYNGLIGVLIEAVKEQQKQIDELKANQ